VSTPWNEVFLVTVYDFQDGWIFCVLLCIHYAFCNTFNDYKAEIIYKNCRIIEYD
jgi:hypothetical protein